MRDRFTRVLKGHIALATARFPKGTTGTQLDAFARRGLWQAGLDYDHGTGHGVGSYLGVHEGPQRISKAPNTQPLLPGMIVSNEPGYYKTGAYGIRIENLVVVQPSDGAAEREMLCFETLTLAPIDRALVDPSLLDDDEIAWLNPYHAHVREVLAPLVDPDTARWLAEATQPIGTAPDFRGRRLRALLPRRARRIERPGEGPSFSFRRAPGLLCRFPIPPVEEMARPQRRRIDAVEAAGIDADLVRVRPRHIKRVHAAMPAKGVLGRVGVELIGRELLAALQQLELRGRHDQMQDALLGADRAVAFEQIGQVGAHPKPHPAAMTTAFISLDHLQRLRRAQTPFSKGYHGLQARPTRTAAFNLRRRRAIFWNCGADG